jgi:hypothetical protein
MKIVINREHGEFNLSPAATYRYAELAGLNVLSKGEKGVWSLLLMHPTYSGRFEDMTDNETKNIVYYFNIARNDKHLIQVIEELGKKASGNFSDLKIVEIPDDVDWIIQEYDGMEWVAERHRTWR